MHACLGLVDEPVEAIDDPPLAPPNRNRQMQQNPRGDFNMNIPHFYLTPHSCFRYFTTQETFAPHN